MTQRRLIITNINTTSDTCECPECGHDNTPPEHTLDEDLAVIINCRYCCESLVVERTHKNIWLISTYTIRAPWRHARSGSRMLPLVNFWETD